MTGVNDTKTVAFWQGEGACIDHDLEAADAMQELARTAWHPVSEPPTEADADDYGYVVVLLGGDEFDCMYYLDVEVWAHTDSVWARIRDVVLLPPA